MNELIEAIERIARAFDALPPEAKEALRKQAALLANARWN